MNFIIGGREHERIVVDVAGYEREPVGEYCDDNWVQSTVSIDVGGFSGQFGAAFMTVDFSRFLNQLIQLHETLNGKAEFITLEEQLKIVATGDGKGHIAVEGEASAAGNRLEFRLESDQTHITQTIKELKKVVSAYPVRPEE